MKQKHIRITSKMSLNANQKVSDSFKFLQPLLRNDLLDLQEVFVLGYSLGRNKQKEFNQIINTMVKIITLRKAFNVHKKELDAIYNLMLEQNWTAVSSSFNSLGEYNIG